MDCQIKCLNCDKNRIHVHKLLELLWWVTVVRINIMSVAVIRIIKPAVLNFPETDGPGDIGVIRNTIK